MTAPDHAPRNPTLGGETHYWCWVCTRMLASTERDDRQARGCGAHCTKEAPMTEALAITKRPTVRLWSHHFHYIVGAEPTRPPERSGDNTFRIHLAINSDIAQALTDAADSLDGAHLSVDTPTGRLCGRIIGWCVNKPGGFYVEAMDLTATYTRLMLPKLPPLHDLPAQRGPITITPEQVRRTAARIVEALRATNDGDAYIGELYRGDDGDGPSGDYLGVHGPVDFLKIAAYLLMHPED
ncbi:hypothetical protein [Tsukamurella sp. NPDC003166]|uniref:hypothetical protein n=1 Tax=Tsukamurella sp. NPDC003166 TaxID=3154444 RepID=UPI0033B3D4C0